MRPEGSPSGVASPDGWGETPPSGHSGQATSAPVWLPTTRSGERENEGFEGWERALRRISSVRVAHPVT